MWVQDHDHTNHRKFNLGLVRLTPGENLETSSTITNLFNWGSNANYGFHLSEVKSRNNVVSRGIYDINGNLNIPSTAYLYAIKVLKIN